MPENRNSEVFILPDVTREEWLNMALWQLEKSGEPVTTNALRGLRYVVEHWYDKEKSDGERQ